MILIPLAEIDAEALPRDRLATCPTALTELQLSIAATGLRMPIEVFAPLNPIPPHRFALISGLRRLTAFRALHAQTGQPRYAAIPAFLRTPASLEAALTAMIEENEVRADISPWEKGHILLASVDQGIFPNLDTATQALHPNLTRQNRTRLRALAHLVEHMPEGLSTPERLTQRQCLRLTAALRAGFAELIALALQSTRSQPLSLQWSRLLPLLTEAERSFDETSPTPHSGPTRPRRILHLRQGLTIRRELSPQGWLLRFSGPEARKGGLMDDVFDEIERMFQPE